MFNNVQLINKAFDRLYEVEKKLNYEYEPMYNYKNKGWKRNLFFKELQKDFEKDVSEFGFCPYIPKTSDIQQKNKNIAKFSKNNNFEKLNYLKSLYKKINSNENKNTNNNKKYPPLTSIRRNKSTKDVDFDIKKRYFLKKINASMKYPREGKFILKCKKVSNKHDNQKQKRNVKKNSSMVNICFKKDKIVNKNENEFIDAESFIYEPEKAFHRHFKNFHRDDESDDENTNVPKNETLFNNISKKTDLKIDGIKTPNNTKVIPLEYFRNLKGALSTENRNNINKINSDSLNKRYKINNFLKNVKTPSNASEDRRFRLFIYSRKIKN